MKLSLEMSDIYGFFKDCPDAYELVPYKKGAYIIRAMEEAKCIWYLISGEVKVVTTSTNGKSFVVDEITPNNFVGHLSNLFEQNFYADSIAVTNVLLLQIPMEKFEELMNRMDFSRFFFSKVNQRLYTMYKKDLAKHLFPQQEQFAYYLLEKSCGDLCQLKSLYKTCEDLRISRRNLYNMIDSFIDEGCLLRDEEGRLIIRNRAKLAEFAQPVTSFLNNTI